MYKAFVRHCPCCDDKVIVVIDLNWKFAVDAVLAKIPKKKKGCD